MTLILIAINIGFFVWQLSFSGDEDYSPGFPGVTERDVNTIEYGATPYRLTHMDEGCALGAELVEPTVAEPAVVCEGTEEYVEAEELGLESPVDDIPPPEPLEQAAWWVTILTSMFMHGGILHITFNMLFLWIFGNNIEDSMGRLRFLLFYLLAGVAAVYAQTAVDPDSTVPTIGASGAVAGVLGAYLLLLPRAKVLTMIFIIFFVTFIEIPAYVMLGIWFVLQFVPAVGQVATPDVAGGGGVAYFAHVGGFIFGLLLIRLFVKERPEVPGQGPAYPVY